LPSVRVKSTQPIIITLAKPICANVPEINAIVKFWQLMPENVNFSDSVLMKTIGENLQGVKMFPHSNMEKEYSLILVIMIIKIIITKMMWFKLLAEWIWSKSAIMNRSSKITKVPHRLQQQPPLPQPPVPPVPPQ